MNYRERFLKVRDFLKPYQNIWQNEIMLMYPDPISAYPSEWIDDLVRFQDKDSIIRLEKRDVSNLVENPSLIEFYKTIEELVEVPPAASLPPMPEDAWTWLFIIPKKQYEIQKLAPHINRLYQENKISQIVDIGGGIGNLAQTLNNQYQHKVVSIDMNAEFQKTGIDRHNKNAKAKDNMVRYKNLKVDSTGEFLENESDRPMTVGLHTCGRLAIDIIRASAAKKIPALCNFGCCYHTLNRFDDAQNISQFAKDNDPITMQQFALTLACRAFKKIDDKDFELKHSVKNFRYAIHILLHDFYDMKELITLGNSSPKLYKESFGVYVLEQFKRIGVTPRHSLEELNAFYNSGTLAITLKRMLTAELIRNATGRVLELYLLLDRCIYLEEQGYQVSLESFFDEQISPRNLGITATRFHHTFGEALSRSTK